MDLVQISSAFSIYKKFRIMQSEIMNYDVLIIGAGPAGLATAIHLKQLAKANKQDLMVAIFEKGSSVVSHIISGCVMDPSSINQLIPDWQNLDFPIKTKVVAEKLLLLTKSCSVRLPILKGWKNDNNYVISLSQLCVRLATYA